MGSIPDGLRCRLGPGPPRRIARLRNASLRSRTVTDETFPKSERVRKSDDYTRILEEGRRVRGRLMSAFWLQGPNGETRPNRVGLAAGKRLGGAVLRNRLKRWMREAYRRHKRELPCRGVSIVLLASRSMVDASYPEVRDDLVKILREMAASLESPSGR